MLAKLIVFGADRRAACRRLRRVVQRAWVPGLVTNLPLLRDIAADEAWLAGELDTGFLARRGLPRPPPLEVQRGATVAAALAWWSRRPSGPLAPAAGWRISGPTEEIDQWSCFGETVEVGTVDEGGALRVRVGEVPAVRVQVLEVDGDHARLRVDDRVQAVRWACDRAGPVEDGATLYLHLGDAEAMLTLVPRLGAPKVAEAAPGSCVASTPAVVRRVYVTVGEQVAEGAPLVVLEAMKLEVTLRAPFAGRVAAVLVAEGEAVAQGALLLRVEGADAV
jgi:acetyl/propionyl-CoA carboxylase alpha subunit